MAVNVTGIKDRWQTFMLFTVGESGMGFFCCCCYNKLQSPEEKRLKATASTIHNDQMQPDAITCSFRTLPPGPTGV